MTYDHELTLIRREYPLDEYGLPQTDEDGNQIVTEIETVILCGLKSVGRTEFYNAAATGLKPELVFIVHGYEYSGESAIEFAGNRYRVIRTYAPGFEEMELTCEKVIADG